jgi:hypothetical protein
MKPATPTATSPSGTLPEGTFVYRDGAWYLVPAPGAVKK